MDVTTCFFRPPQVASQPAIPAGKCAVYKNGTAELALCVDSVVEWGKDVQQVRGIIIIRLGQTQRGRSGRVADVAWSCFGGR